MGGLRGRWSWAAGGRGTGPGSLQRPPPSRLACFSSLSSRSHPASWKEGRSPVKARLPPLSPGRGHPLTPDLIKLCSAEFSRSLEFPPSPSSAAGQPVCEQRPWSSGLTGRTQLPGHPESCRHLLLAQGRPEVGVEDPVLLSGAPSWENQARPRVLILIKTI